MHTFRILRILTAALAINAIFTVSGAFAQVVTPNPPPTIITSQPYTISAPGYYQLGADLISSTDSGDIITINASNVILDFAGHYISGPSIARPDSTINGVHSYERGNLAIRNGTVAFCYRGINLDGRGQTGSLNINQRVENMLVSYCANEAIRFSYASNSVASNCRISFTGSSTSSGDCFALLTSGGSGNQFINNTITNTVAANGTAYGIYGFTDTTVTGNVVNTVTAANGTAYGIFQCGFADHNKVYSAQNGIYGAAKYADNLTVGCTTPFTGGAGFGYNN